MIPGRWFSERDLKFVNSISAEFMGEMVQTVVVIYKIDPNTTKTDLYGESDPNSGKSFLPGVFVTAMIDRSDIETTSDSFGPDRKQNVVFKFREKALENLNVYPEIGDIIHFNQRFHEIDNVVQEQFLGGVSEKSYSIVVNTHYSRLSKLNVVERQV